MAKRSQGTMRLEMDGTIIKQIMFGDYKDLKRKMKKWIKMYGHRIHDFDFIISPYYHYIQDK